jgi:hypothetical protein
MQCYYVPVVLVTTTHTDTRKDWRIIHALQVIDSGKDH